LSKVTRLIEEKNRLRRRVGDLLDEASLRKSMLDHHARRLPRPCGMTVHPALGCPNGCLYCYVPDVLSIPDPPRPYGLSGLELVSALLHNPSFVPGPAGTFLAFGSLCDPFHPRVLPKTVEYLEAVSRWLGNPCQLSTKTPVDRGVLKRLRDLNASLNPLITVVTVRMHRKLEPRAPTPERRFRLMEDMVEVGLRPMLFLRPAIPGLVEREYREILSETFEHGAVGVVVGALRVSRRVSKRLSTVGLHVQPPRRGVFKTLPLRGLKDEIIGYARSLGLIPFASACCANAYSSSTPCMSVCWATGMCTGCPNECVGKLPDVDEEDIAEAFRTMTGIKPLDVEVEGGRVRVAFRGRVQGVRHVRAFFQTATKRLVEFVRLR